MVKCDMMVVGIRVPDNGNGEMLEVELVPLVKSKPKVDMREVQKRMFLGEDMQLVLQESFGECQHRSVVYLSRQYCSEMVLMPFTSLVVDVEPADKQSIQKKYNASEGV